VTPGRPVRKLIEYALPLAVLDREASREKSIRHGHPSTLHLWWSRKPLAAARCVLFAQLVDDPGDRPDLYPTGPEQEAARARLLDLCGRLAPWAVTAGSPALDEARAVLLEQFGGDLPTAYDPFSGGGTIPLEAQRLGLPALGADLNPVAALLTLALVEAPGRHVPTDALAADIRRYGRQVLEIAGRTAARWYPPVRVDGAERAPLAYLWVRTCTCVGCGATVPMLSNPWLDRKAGSEAWLEVSARNGGFAFAVTREGERPGRRVGRGPLFGCPTCGSLTSAAAVQGEARTRGLGVALRCVAVAGPGGREFAVVDPGAASPPVPEPDVPALDQPIDPRASNAPTYGVATYRQLHLPRQRASLAAFAAAVRVMRPQIAADRRSAGDDEGAADAYARDVVLYLGLALGRLANRMSTACIWNAHLGLVEQTFIQNNALALPWDFAEANPFSTASGSWPSQLDWVARVVERLNPAATGRALRADAADVRPELAGASVVVCTDPPYYDYFAYSALSDYFHLWLREALGDAWPGWFAERRPPRTGEVGPGGGAAFAASLGAILRRLREVADPALPITIFYGYRQTSGPAWEGFAHAVASAGLVVTATWPIRTERTEGVKTGRDSLSSSLVLVCRTRPGDAVTCTRAELLTELAEAMPRAVARLQAAGVAPADLAQAAVGPGLAAYTRHSAVLGEGGRVVGTGEAMDAVRAAYTAALDGQEAALGDRGSLVLTRYVQGGAPAGPGRLAGWLAEAGDAALPYLLHRRATERGWATDAAWLSRFDSGIRC
jgi:putative DNA methylase